MMSCKSMFLSCKLLMSRGDRKRATGKQTRKNSSYEDGSHLYSALNALTRWNILHTLTVTLAIL